MRNRRYGIGRSLTDEEVDRIVTCALEFPLLTWSQRRRYVNTVLGISIGTKAIRGILKDYGLSYKRSGHRYVEQDQDQIIAFLMKAWVETDPSIFIFVDESHVDRKTKSVTMGWGPRGQRWHADCPGGRRSDAFSIIAGCSMNGIESVDIYDGSVNSDIFLEWLEKLEVNPYPLPQSVVMDNASVHSHDAAERMIEAKGAQIWFLPAYFPAGNMAEWLFGYVKRRLQRFYDLQDNDLKRQISDIFSDVPIEAFRYFSHECETTLGIVGGSSLYADPV